MRRSSDGDGGEIRGSQQQREERRRGFYGLLQAEHDSEGASAAHARRNNLAVAVVTGAMLVSATLIFLVRHRSDDEHPLSQPISQSPSQHPADTVLSDRCFAACRRRGTTTGCAPATCRCDVSRTWSRPHRLLTLRRRR